MKNTLRRELMIDLLVAESDRMLGLVQVVLVIALVLVLLVSVVVY